MRYYSNPSKNQWPKLAKRAVLNQPSLDETIRGVFRQVEKKGDKALIDLTYKFDRVRLSSLELPMEKINRLAGQVDPEAVVAINQAYKNIYEFHWTTSLQTKKVLVSPGISCWTERRPIEKVGLYVPGGSAPLVSTVLMLGIPAQIAVCKEVLLFTPPDKTGAVNPAIAYAARKCGIRRIFTIGGAQAIAGMAIGTEMIPKVDKIFGPGNQYVTAAKQYAQNYQTAIDMPAGPSEVMVIADQTAKPEFVAADLLSQAEHGPDSQVVLVTNSDKLAQAILKQIKIQVKTLPRQDIAKASLKNSFIAVLSKKNSVEFANLYAPEHLILNISMPGEMAKRVSSAGSVFIGSYSPESAGDYASGTNHTLPTGGWARSCSGLSVKDFQRTITFQKLTRKGLKNLSKTVTTLANLEGLDAHARAISIRLKS